MFNEKIVGTVTQFSGTSTPDKNGNYPVMIQCIAGKMPNRNVLSGTVAERAGFELGKTYLMQVRQAGTDKVFGDDFNFVKITELKSGLDIIQASKELGDPQIVTIPRPEGFKDAYQRQGDAIISVRTKREREGLYQRAIPSTTSDHSTAREEKEGTSITTARREQVELSPEELLNTAANDRKDDQGSGYGKQRQGR